MALCADEWRGAALGQCGELAGFVACAAVAVCWRTTASGRREADEAHVRRSHVPHLDYRARLLVIIRNVSKPAFLTGENAAGRRRVIGLDHQDRTFDELRACADWRDLRGFGVS